MLFDGGSVGGVAPAEHYRVLMYATPDLECVDPDAASSSVIMSPSTLSMLYEGRTHEGPALRIPGLLALALVDALPSDVLGVIVQNVDHEVYACVAFASLAGASAVAGSLVGLVRRVIEERNVSLGYYSIDIELSRCAAPVDTDIDVAPVEKLASDHVAGGQFVFPGVIDMSDDGAGADEESDEQALVC